MKLPRIIGDARSKPYMRSTSGGVDIECRPEAPILKELLAYWQQRRRAPDRLPARADIDPTEIPTLLPYLFLVDVQREPRVYRYRLFSTELAESYGRDITGKSLDEVFSDIFRKATYVVFNEVVERAHPLRTFGTMTWREQRKVQFESIQLPLARHGTTVDMILGSIVYD